MPTRLAACEACRVSKLACDHQRPACSRCRDRDRAASCNYRSRPFKKKGRQYAAIASVDTPSRLPPVNPLDANVEQPMPEFPTALRSYPNPGYQGSSSHTTFFDQLPPQSSGDLQLIGHSFDETSISQGAQLIQQLRQSSLIPSCAKLIAAWSATGVSLALAGPFVETCVQATQHVLEKCAGGTEAEVTSLSNELFQHSSRPVVTDTVTTFEQFCSRFGTHHVRWESLGLFFVAASRAVADIARFEPLYTSELPRRRFQRLATHYSDQCLDLALSLDCLNDLQLVLQYESYIVHSYIGGDQRYHTWRKLGDVVSSLFALGYHEQAESSNRNTPAFLQDLRRSAFARAYSADKNVSIFFGRPPRINRNYCRFALPGQQLSAPPARGGVSLAHYEWSLEEGFSYVVDTRWSAICAVLKEEILELFLEEDYEIKASRARDLQVAAESQWLALPDRFRLTRPLKTYDRHPMERDFLVSAWLNHLHVLLLLHLAVQRKMPEPDAHVTEVAATMLGVISESVILKDQLANSGTSLVWRVAYYGLAAAGIVCLALLKGSIPSNNSDVTIGKAVQDLNVLVAAVDSGALVHVEDPSYASVARAILTIKSLLNRVLTKGLADLAAVEVTDVLSPQEPQCQNFDDWNPWDSNNIQDFEVDFWLNLAEHPLLASNDNDMHSASL